MSVSLHDFVKQTLLDITTAVHEARETSPLWIAPGTYENKKNLLPQLIEFSVQVTASEAKTEKGEGKLSVPVITIVKAGIAGSIDTSKESQTTQTLKFSVPVYFQSLKQ